MSIHWSRELFQWELQLTKESLPFCGGQNQEVGCLDLNGSFSTTFENSLKMEVSFDLGMENRTKGGSSTKREQLNLNCYLSMLKV